MPGRDTKVDSGGLAKRKTSAVYSNDSSYIVTYILLASVTHSHILLSLSFFRIIVLREKNNGKICQHNIRRQTWRVQQVTSAS